MGERGRREGRCSHHLSTYHLLTYPSFHVFLVLVLRPYLYLLHDVLIPTPYASLQWDSPPCSGLSWEWGNGSALPIFLCYTEVRTFSWWSYVGPLLTHTRQTFSLRLLIPKTLNQKNKRWFLCSYSAELFDLHSTQPRSTRTCLTSLSSLHHPCFPQQASLSSR